MKIVGLDLSLTGTGYGCITDPDRPVQQWWTETITSRGTNADSEQVTRTRILRIVSEVTERVWVDQPHLIVLEGPAFGAKGGHAHDRSGLWWLIYDALMARDLTVAVVKPNTRAMYATGKGTASKDTVLAAAIRRYKDAPIHNNNEADAMVLAAMGARACEWPVERDLPLTHLRAMTAVQWPSVPSATPASR